MFPGPVFKLELRRLSRRKRYYALLTLYGLVLLYVVWSNNPQTMFVVPAGPAGGLSVDQWHYAGKSLFESYTIWQMAMVVLLTPAMVAGVIAEEHERKTMPSLLASRLTSGEIVLGKLCARLLALACFVALGLPILALVQQFGGVDLKGVLITFAGTATTAFFLGAASILVSTFARRPRDAVVSAYLLDVVWHIGTAGLLLVFSSGLLRMFVEWIGWTCPLLVMFGHVRGTRFWESPNLSDFVRMMLLQVALGAVMTTIAVRRLRAAFRNDDAKQPFARAAEPDLATPESKASHSTNTQTEPQPERSSFQATRNDGVTPTVKAALPELSPTEPPPAQFQPRPPCGDDAMLWKEIRATPFSLFTRVL
jgi:ABC-type transport system involved in multi-copper enzyme maturation permease subunit